MAQSVERRIGSAEVPGPIPGASFYRVQEMVEISRFLIFLCLFYDALKMSRMVQDIHFCGIDNPDTVFSKLYDMIAVVPAQLLP